MALDRISFDVLVTRIEQTEARGRTRLIAIDGRGGAGKSSLAKRLADQLSDVTVVEVDDFWLGRNRRPERAVVIDEPGSDYDWMRLRDQVVVPLSRDERGRYRRYDWRSDTLMEWHDVPVGGTLIIEGVFSIRELASFYDVCIWVDTPSAVCLERGYERDGEEHRDLWDNEWMPAYENYIRKYDPAKLADCVVEGV
jgi:uridine kinase